MHFLAILEISGENGVPDWSPRGCKPAEKTVHHPSWVISEALPRVYFALPACLGPNTPSGGPLRWPTKGGVPVFLLACILWETSMAHRFRRKSPKSPKSAQIGVSPLFDQFFSKVAPLQTLLLPIFEKKCGFAPSRPSTGGKSALFSGNRRPHGL